MLTPEQLTEMEQAVKGAANSRILPAQWGEQVSELEKRIANEKCEASLCSSELVSLRQQLARVDAMADAIDEKLGVQPDHTMTPDHRIGQQLRGLITALSSEKSKQANDELKHRRE